MFAKLVVDAQNRKACVVVVTGLSVRHEFTPLNAFVGLADMGLTLEVAAAEDAPVLAAHV